MEMLNCIAVFSRKNKTNKLKLNMGEQDVGMDVVWKELQLMKTPVDSSYCCTQATSLQVSGYEQTKESLERLQLVDSAESGLVLLEVIPSPVAKSIHDDGLKDPDLIPQALKEKESSDLYALTKPSHDYMHTSEAHGSANDMEKSTSSGGSENERLSKLVVDTSGESEESTLILHALEDKECSDLYALTECNHDYMYTSEVHSNTNDTEKRASGSGSENGRLSKLGIGVPDLTDESEDDYEVFDSEGCRIFSKEKARPQGGNFASQIESALYYESPNHYVLMSCNEPSSGDCTQPSVGNISADCGHAVDVGSAWLSENPNMNALPSNNSERLSTDEEMLIGHISDPGVYYEHHSPSACGSPLLQHSCSIVPSETVDCVSPRNPELVQGACHKELCTMAQAGQPHGGAHDETTLYSHGDSHSSPRSELTYCSADKVLKPASSSKFFSLKWHKTWWRIFMNGKSRVRKAEITKLAPLGEVTDGGHKSGLNHYPDDRNNVASGSTLSQIRTEQYAQEASAEQEFKGFEVAGPSGSKRGFEPALQAMASGSTTLNQWVSLPPEQPDMKRVEEWVINVSPLALPPEDKVTAGRAELTVPHPQCNIDQEGGEDRGPILQDSGVLSMDAELAAAAVRTLNAFSTVANITGVGLRVVPSLGMFNSLKTINLSANCIVRITPGSLPRSLHSLDLSRNRIATIEGLKELTHLRVLNLSYNRISRIGHGLASCTLIKELYLAANKISDLEGFHRLLKLSVLDLSFNKLTTSKCLGQLAANYSSLLALNLLGNPVNINLGEEQLRKLVISIVPHVLYLNKQPIKAVSAREVAVDSVARAALGTSQRGQRSRTSSSRGSRRGGESVFAGQQKKSLRSHCGKDADRRPGQLSALGFWV